MIADLGQIAFGLATPPALGYGLSRVLPGTTFYWLWCTSAIGGAIGSALPPAAWPQSASNGVSLIVAAVLWWLSRRRRKRAPKAMGAKSRALLAAVVAKMRQSLKPRPVFKPAPGGARLAGRRGEGDGEGYCPDSPEGRRLRIHVSISARRHTLPMCSTPYGFGKPLSRASWLARERVTPSISPIS